MARLTLVLVALVLACGVRKLDASRDSLSFTVAGERYEFDTELSEGAGAAFAFDDRGVVPPLYDPYSKVALVAVSPPQMALRISTWDGLGSGTFELERTRLGRATSPLVRLSLEPPGMPFNSYVPAGGGDTITIELTGATISVQFDRIELVDVCDNAVVLEDGVGSAVLRTSEVADALPTMADVEVTQDEVDGGAHLVTSVGPFNTFFPSLAVSSGTIQGYLPNNCDTNGLIDVALLVDVGTALRQYAQWSSSVYLIAEIDPTPPYTIDATDYRSYLSDGGVIDLVENSGRGGFVGVVVSSPVTMIRYWFDESDALVTDRTDTFMIESGEIRSFVR
jgi:hypothetical protein